MDDVWTKLGSAPIGSTSQNDYFVDRTLLYTIRDKITPTTIGATAYKASDVNLSGAIEHWEFATGSTSVEIYGTYNYANGTNPNFISEIQPNEDGSFNPISIPNPVDPTKVWVIEDIKKISLNLENNDEDDDIPIILEKKGDIETLSEEDLNHETLEEVSINNLSIEVDYEKYKVAELKQMCEDKELENYKKLKKSDLIDLLKNNL